jgi:hypothetical protein
MDGLILIVCLVLVLHCNGMVLLGMCMSIAMVVLCCPVICCFLPAFINVRHLEVVLLRNSLCSSRLLCCVF